MHEESPYELESQNILSCVLSLEALGSVSQLLGSVSQRNCQKRAYWISQKKQCNFHLIWIDNASCVKQPLH